MAGLNDLKVFSFQLGDFILRFPPGPLVRALQANKSFLKKPLLFETGAQTALPPLQQELFLQAIKPPNKPVPSWKAKVLPTTRIQQMNQ